MLPARIFLFTVCNSNNKNERQYGKSIVRHSVIKSAKCAGRGFGGKYKNKHSL